VKGAAGLLTDSLSLLINCSAAVGSLQEDHRFHASGENQMIR
jgi:hypothetical protein